jgi:hypothetical protein
MEQSQDWTSSDAFTLNVQFYLMHAQQNRHSYFKKKITCFKQKIA